MVTPDDQSMDSVATSSIGFSDLEDQILDLGDGSLSSNVDNGVVGSGGNNKGNSAELDVSNHNKASAAQAVATDLVREDQAVSRSRILVSLVLVIAATFLGVATYWFLSEDQNERMQQEASPMNQESFLEAVGGNSYRNLTILLFAHVLFLRLPNCPYICC